MQPGRSVPGGTGREAGSERWVPGGMGAAWWKPGGTGGEAGSKRWVLDGMGAA
jgi:hypothetical protein